MKQFLLAVAAIIPFFAQAEEDKKKKDFFENSYVGVSWGPDFYFWKDKAPASNTEYTYSPKFSNSFGFEFVKSVHDRVLISTGLQFATRSFERSDKCLTCADVSYTPVSDFKASYLSIPVSAYFLLMNSRLDVIGIFGIDNSILRKSSENRLNYNGSHSKFDSKSSFNAYVLSLQAGFGFNYTVNLHFSWGMNVMYKQPVMPVTLTPQVNAFGFNLNTGFYYKFN